VTDVVNAAGETTFAGMIVEAFLTFSAPLVPGFATANNRKQ